MANYAQMVGAPIDTITQAANIHNPAGQWNQQSIQSIMDRNRPAYGLNPALAALSGGLQSARDETAQTRQNVAGMFAQGQNMLQPYREQGGQASQLQAALSGALGREAQAKAFQDYVSSPGVEFATRMGEQGITRNAAALGGLGGGNVRRELMEFGTGMATQDFGNQFNRLGDLANRGYGAATTGAGLQQSAAGIESNLGQFAANLPMQSASLSAQMRQQTGRDMSGNIGGVTSGLSNLISGGATGVSNAIGQQGNMVGSLYEKAAAGDAQAREQLAGLLQNTNMNAAGQFTGVGTTPLLSSNYGQSVNSALGGAAGMMYAMGPQAPSTGPNTSFNTVPGYGPTYTGPYQPQPNPVTTALGGINSYLENF
jgi:hypothetical protein